MKIIFLDIDGVLNGYGEDYDYEGIEGAPDSTGCTQHLLSRHLIDNFNYLVKYTGAKVVVSSTWRLGETVGSMQSIFDSVGIECEVVGLTGRDSSSIRGVEIFKWIKDNIEDVPYHSYNDYVIIDDDSDMLLWQKDNFVNTKGERGLTRGDMWKAITILGGVYETN